MSKSSKKPKTVTPTPPEIRRLKFNGENGNPFLRGIPARDLEHHELIEIALSHNMLLEDLVTMLCADTPGRRIAPGKPLYSPNKPYICADCSKEFDDWEDLHKHALTHIESEE